MTNYHPFQLQIIHSHTNKQPPNQTHVQHLQQQKTIIKSKPIINHAHHFKQIFSSIQQYKWNIRVKSVFGMMELAKNGKLINSQSKILNEAKCQIESKLFN